jgi:hypothetical protein
MAVDTVNDEVIDGFVTEVLAAHPGESFDAVAARWRVRRGLEQLPWGEQSRVRGRWELAGGHLVQGDAPPTGAQPAAGVRSADTASGVPLPTEAPWLPEVRSWARWNLVLGVISFPFNPAWGVALLVTGLASWRFRDRSMLVVYGCVLGWAAFTNLLLGEVGWKAFSLLQGYWAVQLFRKFRQYGPDGASPSEYGPAELGGWDAGRIFPWVGIVASGIAAYAFIGLGIVLAVASAGEEFGAISEAWAMATSLAANVAALGFAVALASVLSGYDHPTLSKAALVASGIPIALWSLMLLLASVI